MSKEFEAAPAQQAADTGLSLAHQANEVLTALQAAEGLAGRYENALSSGVQVDNEAHRGVVANIGDKQKLFHGLLEASGALIGPRSLGYSEVSAKDSTKLPAPEKPASVWDMLEGSYPEKVSLAEEAKKALAEAYGRDEEDFSLVKAKPAFNSDRPGYSVVLTSTEGIDLGNPGKKDKKRRSWDSIKPTKTVDDFVLVTRRAIMDVRRAQSMEVLAEAAKINPEIDEWVLETARADLARPGKGFFSKSAVPVVCVRDGKVARGSVLSGDGDANLRFRPAVRIV